MLPKAPKVDYFDKIGLRTRELTLSMTQNKTNSKSVKPFGSYAVTDR